MTPNPKHIAYRNPAILKLAKDKPCQHCGKNDGSTVAAHANGLFFGKGMGKKSQDMFVAFLCGECHADYDQKRVTKWLDKSYDPIEYRKLSQEDFNRAMHKTMSIWLPILLPTKE